jgi:hypothetical protein
MKLTIRLYLVRRSRMVELHVHSPIRLDGVVLTFTIIGVGWGAEGSVKTKIQKAAVR